MAKAVFSHSWQHISTAARRFIAWLCGGIIVPLIIIPLLFKYCIEPVEKNMTEANTDLIELKTSVRELFFKDEETWRFCAENQTAVKNAHYEGELTKINAKRDAAFEKLITLTASLFDKQAINANTYNTIKNFAQWNNALYLSHQNVCSMKLKDSAELLAWRVKIINNF